jgi:hypothetical protein
MAGVVDGGLGARPDSASSAVALEQWNTESAFELGKALRQRRRAHADMLCGHGPRRRIGDGDQVLELANREIGEWPHPAEDTSDLLHNPTSM